ncbi:axial regulator yabby 4 [Phtheirospermum japonicum]|uniref:Axial regulator yabby 4 n=1 Tax=Phtheirospermum japonicum TaxID=374723 RepID=A0A830BUE5_9LAMI|nr:axial regulator yabby 4 [Phtheirospermum japonicum]
MCNVAFAVPILLVNVPCSSLSKVVTVKCGHCNSILSVNMMKACLLPFHFFSSLNQHDEMVKTHSNLFIYQNGELVLKKLLRRKQQIYVAPSLCFSSDEDDDENSIEFNQIIHKPPQKKQRAPSAYNCFIKEEIKRLKIEHPNMTHKQAFSAASKNVSL